MRRAGGGRRRTIDKDTTLLADLDALVEPLTLGDPDSPLRWTSKSVRHLADELTVMGHAASYQLVARLLKESGYSLQANRKTREGSHHEDRDAQFRYINQQVCDHFERANPAISVDTKKKELVGDFKNPGREWGPKGSPESVRVHDFLIPDLGKAIPCFESKILARDNMTRSSERVLGPVACHDPVVRRSKGQLWNP
jgi:hypothetical protein